MQQPQLSYFQQISKEQYQEQLTHSKSCNKEENQSRNSSNLRQTFLENALQQKNINLLSRDFKKKAKQHKNQIEKIRTQNQQCYLKFKRLHKLSEKSHGIILFKQDFQQIYKLKQLRERSANLKQILIKFYAVQEYDSKFQKILGLTILIQNQKITLSRINESRITANIKQKPIFAQNPPNSKFVLQRKIWIQINRGSNKISVNTGDINNFNSLHNSKLVEILSSSLNQVKKDWKNCEISYEQLEQNKSEQKLKNPLLRLSHFEVFIKISKLQRKWNTTIKHDILNPQKYLKIKCLRIEEKKGPQLKQNPSVLQPNVPAFICMPQQIKSLYSRLHSINLSNFLNLQSKATSSSNWIQTEEQICFSIHNSLTTPYQFIQNENKQFFPLGILNHMLKVKTDNQFHQLFHFNHSSQSMKSIYKEILLNRVGYLRFKILQSNGFCPGSPAILEIWPPFYCSPIHNHRNTFGVVKILMGSIRIENFQQLSFQASSQPYLKADYRKGQYTWLSQNSYGSHRVLNLNSMTSMTLQGYYDHNQGTDQYFSFIQEKQSINNNKQKHLSVYYPQHDWQNYLDKNSVNSFEDKQFIDLVITYYSLRNENTDQIDYSFQKFIKIMLEQYNLQRQIIDCSLSV